MKTLLLSLAVLLFSCGCLVSSSFVMKDSVKKNWGPMECATDDFKHDRYDGEEFDLEAQKEAKNVIVEKQTESGKFHLRIQLDEKMNPKYFLGNWSCGAESWVVVGDPVIARLGKPADENLLRPSLAVMEEEKVKLRCEAFYFGNEEPKVAWNMLHEETGEELNITRWSQADEKEGEFKTISTLTLNDENGVQMSDRANYTCTVSVTSGSSVRGILLRVKDKFAALWPFLGICAEVVILCVGIFIYERRTKNQTVEGDEEEEVADAQVADAEDAKQEEVRKRAPVKT